MYRHGLIMIYCMFWASDVDFQGYQEKLNRRWNNVCPLNRRVDISRFSNPVTALIQE